MNSIFPVLGFGTASIVPEYNISAEQAIDTVQYAYEQGMRFFDTAPHYGAYAAEERSGLALRGINRTSYILETKVGRLIQPDGTRIFDFSRDGILRSFEGSLMRLKTDYIDSVLLHDPYDYETQVREEAHATLLELKAQGVVKRIGIGIKDYVLLKRLAQTCEFDVFMQAGHYSLLEQEAQAAMHDFAQRGITVLLAKVYQSGILATGAIEGAQYNYRPAPPQILERVKAIEVLCQQHAMPLRAAALQFARAHPAVNSLVIGMQTRQHVDDAQQMLKHPIPAQFWQNMREAAYLPQGAITP